MYDIKVLPDPSGRWHVTIHGHDVWRCDFARKDVAEAVAFDLRMMPPKEFTYYLGETLGKDWRKLLHIGPGGRHVQCVEAGYVFSTKAAAAQWADMPYSNFSEYLRNRSAYSTLRGLHWTFTDAMATQEDEISPIYTIPGYDPYDGYRKRPGVECVTTGDRFDTIHEAAVWSGSSEAGLSRALKNGVTYKGMVWRYVE